MILTLQGEYCVHDMPVCRQLEPLKTTFHSTRYPSLQAVWNKKFDWQWESNQRPLDLEAPITWPYGLNLFIDFQTGKNLNKWTLPLDRILYLPIFVFPGSQ